MLRIPQILHIWQAWRKDWRSIARLQIHLHGGLANEPLACRQLYATYVTCARIIPPPSNFALNWGRVINQRRAFNRYRHHRHNIFLELIWFPIVLSFIKYISRSKLHYKFFTKSKRTLVIDVNNRIDLIAEAIKGWLYDHR